MIDALTHDSTLWVLISFVLFLYVAYRFGKNAVIGGLDSKIEEIRKEIETAESLRVEAQELLAQYQRKQRDAEQEAGEIIARAKDHAEKIKVQAETDLAEVMARREAQLADRIKRIEQNAMAEIKAHAAQLAIQATHDVIAQDLDQKTEEDLLSASIKTVSSQLN